MISSGWTDGFGFFDAAACDDEPSASSSARFREGAFVFVPITEVYCGCVEVSVVGVGLGSISKSSALLIADHLAPRTCFWIERSPRVPSSSIAFFLLARKSYFPA